MVDGRWRLKNFIVDLSVCFLVFLCIMSQFRIGMGPAVQTSLARDLQAMRLIATEHAAGANTNANANANANTNAEVSNVLFNVPTFMGGWEHMVQVVWERSRLQHEVLASAAGATAAEQAQKVKDAGKVVMAKAGQATVRVSERTFRM
jgi:hypothetical protein